MTRAAGRRRRLGVGIYRDQCGISIVARAGRHTKEVRRPLGTPLAECRRLRQELRQELAASSPPPAERGTLAADVDRYLRLAGHLADVTARRAELRAWLAAVGSRRSRYSLTRAELLTVRSTWLAAGVAPKTVNNRVTALRALWTALDGPERTTPADGLRPLPVRRAPPVAVDAGTLAAVYAALARREAAGLIRDQKTRARFRLLAETGRRPCEVMRAQPDDFDLGRGIWHVRDAKGGLTPGGVYLTDSIRAAVVAFIQADAFGPFNTGSMARTLRAAGWPAGLRPYTLRHGIGQALADAGADHMDIAAAMGHRDPRTTRHFYVGIRESRTRAALERIAGRVAWTVPDAAAVETARGKTP